jgi:nucleoside-triphosphatase
MIKNILITGMPGAGKSTLLQKVISKYNNKVGFITKEIREGDERKGFEIETNKGNKATLAHISFKTSHKVSKYCVNVENLESVLPKITDLTKEDVLYIDEIGQMELFSDNFKKLVLKYLDSENICLATVTKVYENDFTKELLKRKDVIFVEINKENREAQCLFVEMLIKKIKKAQNYVNQKERFKIKENKAEMTSTHAKRTLKYIDGLWNCDCDFFKKYSICSHSIALKEIAP